MSLALQNQACIAKFSVHLTLASTKQTFSPMDLNNSVMIREPYCEYPNSQKSLFKCEYPLIFS